jgi:hypothetical protein
MRSYSVDKPAPPAQILPEAPIFVKRDFGKSQGCRLLSREEREENWNKNKWYRNKSRL